MKDLHLTVNLSDVVDAGSVEAAVESAVRADNTLLLATSAAMGGQTFATSGPGSGWTVEFDANDYAYAAIKDDLYHSGGQPSDSVAVDPSDGRWCVGVDDIDPDDGWTGKLEWSDESAVELECPTIEDAVEWPGEVLEMAEAVRDTHGARSDVGDWKKLVAALIAAGEMLDSLDEWATTE